MDPYNSILTEIATREAAGGLNLSGWLCSLPDPDPILRKRGDYATVLDDLTADDSVITAIQQRKLKTLLKRDYAFAPGQIEGQEATPEAQRLCDDLARDLERVDLYNLIAQVLDAPYYGYTVAEILWRSEAGRWRIQDIVPKPRSWFSYDYDNQLCFLGNGSQLQRVPAHKFIVARHFPDFNNPYGLRLLSRCLWPVAFKKGGVNFWLKFCEKFGQPWVLGKSRPGADKAERETMAADLARMVSDAVAVTSSGSEVDVHEFSGAAGNLHHQLVTYWDNSISKVLKGQTLTSDIGNVGSRAASQTHYDVLEDLAAADSVLVEAFCNELGFVYRQINATPDTLAPCFSYEHPEDLASLAELDAKLYEQGVRYKAGYYARVYGRKEEEFTVVADTVVADTAPSAEAASFAAPLLAKDGEAEIAAQAEIDALADALLRDAPRLGQSLAADLVQTLSRAETFDDAQILLAEALCQAEGTNEFETVLAAGMRAAHLAGQSAVKKAQVL